MSRHAMKHPNKAGANTPKASPEVKAGDVWEDCDKRTRDANGNPRRVKVDTVEGRYAHGWTIGAGTLRGRPVRIACSRMKPTSTGYKLVERDGKAVP